MARRPRNRSLENRTARLKLPVQKKPQHFTAISPGIALGYRRCQGAGRWVIRVADGRSGMWTKAIALADDFEDADGEHVLSWFEAQDRARALARGKDTTAAGRPATVGEALDEYQRDLASRQRDVNNADRVRRHLTPTLLSKPVALLTAVELRRWRYGLIEDGNKTGTVNRTIKGFKGALNLAAANDPRITNQGAWREAFAKLKDTYRAADAILTDAEVGALIAAAHALDPSFGILIETAAVTGARFSQLARLEVADLQARGSNPRLMMPSSLKGRDREIERRPLPIPASLAAKLHKAAAKRPATDPLLLKGDGTPWNPKRSEQWHPFAQIAEQVGLAGHTMYSLRHSAITRALLKGVPIRVVAVNADTSVAMIEKTYSKFIADHADEITREALLDPAALPAAANIIPLRKG
jgi:integrase